jgi:hypothetical protein
MRAPARLAARANVAPELPAPAASKITPWVLSTTAVTSRHNCSRWTTSAGWRSRAWRTEGHTSCAVERAATSNHRIAAERGKRRSRHVV